MTARSLTTEATWLTVAGLLVSFHRLAMGFYLSDVGADGLVGVGLVVLGGLAALVLTGAQMLLASTLATIDDLLLRLAWLVLLVCAVVVMSASTLASMHGADLATVVAPGWLRLHFPAVVVAVGLSMAIEVSLASIRRASALIAATVDDDLGLTSGEAAELEVQAELRRHEAAESPALSAKRPASSFERQCDRCGWDVMRPTELGAANALRAHQRSCRS